jgi:hypothetical protein
MLVRIRSNKDGIWIGKSDPDNVFMVTAMAVRAWMSYGQIFGDVPRLCQLGRPTE